MELRVTVNCINADERISHKLLGGALGLAYPHKIRHMVERNQAEFERYGEVLSTVDETTGGRPGKTIWLNEGQSVLAAVRSDAPRAPQVRYEVISAYMEYRRHKQGSPTQIHERIRVQVDRLEALARGMSGSPPAVLMVGGLPVLVDCSDYALPAGTPAVAIQWDGALAVVYIAECHSAAESGLGGPRLAYAHTCPSGGKNAPQGVLVIGRALTTVGAALPR